MKTILLLSLVALAGCEPKTFTPRIVKNDDGTYTTQYYWPHPGYIADPNGFHVSLEDAQRKAASWQRTADGDKPTIVSTK